MEPVDLLGGGGGDDDAPPTRTQQPTDPRTPIAVRYRTVQLCAHGRVAVCRSGRCATGLRA